jgi:rod shape-determining protein MreD
VSRSLLLALLGLVLHAIEAGAAVAFGLDGLPLTPAVVLVAYAALAEPPVEAAVSAILLGLVLDAVSGSPLGLNMLACLIALLSGRLLSSWVSAPRGLPALAFTAGMSAGYHLFILILRVLFAGHREVQGVLDVAAVAFGDGLFAVVLMPSVQWAFVRLGLEDPEDPLEARLSSRVRRR